MSLITRPMLAVPAKLESIKYPVLATPKIDGIRTLKLDGSLVSRTFHPIPNKHIKTILESILPDEVDGELLSGKTFQDATSAIMSEDGSPDFTYYIFDFVPCLISEKYTTRVARLHQLANTLKPYPYIKVLLPVTINNETELLAYEQQMLDAGFEGVIIRSPDSPYKCGRSTLQQGYLLKIKRFVDSEATVSELEELTTNNNPAKKDAFGNSKRSSHKANLVGAGTLGTIVAVDKTTGQTIRIGSGLTAEQREYYWKNPDQIIGKLVKYKHFPKGSKDKPRHAVFLGIRDPKDL